MNAKETVMTEEMFKLLRGQYEREERTDSFECYSLKAQAKISFKTGIKEAVDKVEKQIWKSLYISPDNKQKVINGIKHSLKLKEWGYEETKD